MRKGVGMLASVGMVVGVATVAGCGGGGAQNSDDDALRLVKPAFQLTGAESTTLDLTQSDVVLAAGLGSLSAASNLRGIDYFGFDSGTPEPGAGRGDCLNGGEARESAIDGIGIRDVLFELFQCYSVSGPHEVVTDGSVRVFKISSLGGQIEGTVEPGIDGRVLGSAVRSLGDEDFELVQTSAVIDYEGDADEDQSSTVGGRILVALANEGETRQVTFRKGFEIFAGPDGIAFETHTTQLSDTLNQITFEGPLVFRGAGMKASCNVTGGYSVTTADALVLDYSGDEGRATDGLLSIASGEANASVEFLADGDALVTTANGATVTYQAPDVDSHCDLDS